jgi:hypothetical protein
MAQSNVPVVTAPAGWVWFVTFLGSLIVLGWAYRHTNPTLSLFATVYLSFLTILLLRYWIRELRAEYKLWTVSMQR